jgi:hypothetical protein
MKQRQQILAQAFKTKAYSLFAFRCLPECLTFAAEGCENKSGFLLWLLELQCAIYGLDSYGESQWTLNTNELDTIWMQIRHAWIAVPLQAQNRPTLDEIEQYQIIEIGMRFGKRPDLIQIHKFYRAKTCDVRLMRALIWNAFRPPSAQVKRLWEIFDLLGEVFDDLTDLEEDRITYNGNRLLFCIRQRGRAAAGHAYKAFITWLLNEVEKFDDAGAPAHADSLFLIAKCRHLGCHLKTLIDDISVPHSVAR